MSQLPNGIKKVVVFMLNANYLPLPTGKSFNLTYIFQCQNPYASVKIAYFGIFCLYYHP